MGLIEKLKGTEHLKIYFLLVILDDVVVHRRTTETNEVADMIETPEFPQYPPTPTEEGKSGNCLHIWGLLNIA